MKDKRVKSFCGKIIADIIVILFVGFVVFALLVALMFII